jgi:hypothetical protein
MLKSASHAPENCIFLNKGIHAPLQLRRLRIAVLLIPKIERDVIDLKCLESTRYQGVGRRDRPKRMEPRRKDGDSKNPPVLLK